MVRKKELMIDKSTLYRKVGFEEKKSRALRTYQFLRLSNANGEVKRWRCIRMHWTVHARQMQSIVLFYFKFFFFIYLHSLLLHTVATHLAIDFPITRVNTYRKQYICVTFYQNYLNFSNSVKIFTLRRWVEIII